MMLKAKIKPKYLDEIIKGKKQFEYREIEGMEFDDGNRKAIFEVIDVDDKIDDNFLETHFPDIKWGNKPKIRILIGKMKECG